MGEEYPSPDGKYILYLSCNEMRMSHWVCTPKLVEVESGRTLYEGSWDSDAGDIKWSDDSLSLRFYLRVYPGSAPGNYVLLKLTDGEVILESEPPE